MSEAEEAEPTVRPEVVAADEQPDLSNVSPALTGSEVVGENEGLPTMYGRMPT